MPEQQRQPRHQLTVQRDCTLRVIALEDLDWADHTAHLVDISAAGVGIESSQPLAGGFVWFRDRVGGHKGGVLIWSRQHGELFRSGIKFVHLSREEEHFVHDQVAGLSPHRLQRDPEQIISALLESIAQTAKTSN